MDDPMVLLAFALAGALVGLATRYVQMNNRHWFERQKLAAETAKILADREDLLRREYLARESETTEKHNAVVGKLLDRIQAKDLTDLKTVGSLPDRIEHLTVPRPDVTTDEGEMEYRRLLGLEPKE